MTQSSKRAGKGRNDRGRISSRGRSKIIGERKIPTRTIDACKVAHGVEQRVGASVNAQALSAARRIREGEVPCEAGRPKAEAVVAGSRSRHPRSRGVVSDEAHLTRPRHRDRGGYIDPVIGVQLQLVSARPGDRGRYGDVAGAGRIGVARP